VRVSREIVRAADAQGIRSLYASADPDEPMAEKWLTRLGFVPDGRVPGLLRRGN